MVWLPVGKRTTVDAAVPPMSGRFAHAARGEALSGKETVPSGVPAPGETGDTVAVTVTFCPPAEGLALEDTVVPVPAGLTVYVVAGDDDAVKLASPAKLALRTCVPTLSVDVA